MSTLFFTKCKKCGKTFDSKYDLDQHSKVKHPLLKFRKRRQDIEITNRLYHLMGSEYWERLHATYEPWFDRPLSNSHNMTFLR